MSRPPCNGTTFFRRCLLGAFLSKILTKTKVLHGTLRYCVARSQRPTTTSSISGPDRAQFHVQIDLNFKSRSTSILRPDRPQFYIQFDLNFTSNSISILRQIRFQFYIQFDLNFTSNSTSILRPIRPQFYVQFDLNFTSIRPQFYVQIETNGTRFFCRRYGAGGTWNSHSRQYNHRKMFLCEIQKHP